MGEARGRHEVEGQEEWQRGRDPCPEQGLPHLGFSTHPFPTKKIGPKPKPMPPLGFHPLRLFISLPLYLLLSSLFISQNLLF